MSSKFEINIDSIEQTLQSVGNRAPQKSAEKDTRQFRPTIKNEKKEYRAVVRFLPQVLPNSKESKPYVVERWTHSFTENGQWYFENCPSLLNKREGNRDHKCPACEQNREDYDSKQEVLISRAKTRKVKKSFATNILVIEDVQNPQNNGTVMYWNMPVEIYKMIEGKWKPESKKKAPSNPYCPVKGYALDLVLKWNPASGYPTYSGSEWLDQEPLADTDEEMIEIIGRAIDLDEFTSPSMYKPYEDLKKRYSKVTAGGVIVDSNSFGVNTIFAEDVVTTALDKTISSISTATQVEAPKPTTRKPRAQVVEEAPPVEIVEPPAVDDGWLD
jgi:hypothetical protein